MTEAVAPSQGLQTKQGGWKGVNRKKRGRKNAKKSPRLTAPVDTNFTAVAETRASFKRVALRQDAPSWEPPALRARSSSGGKGGRRRRNRKSRGSTVSKKGGPLEEMVRMSNATTARSRAGTGIGSKLSEGLPKKKLSILANPFVPIARKSKLNANTTEFVPSTDNVAIPSRVAMPPQYEAPMMHFPLSPGGTSFLNPGAPHFTHPNVNRLSNADQPLVYPPIERVAKQVRTEFRQPTPPGLILKPPTGININKAEFDGIPSPPPYHPKDGWTVYWNPPTSIKHSTHNEEYLKSLKELQSFDGIADFWTKVKKIQPPSKITHGSHNLMVFRKGLVPAWESFPHGGCWIVTYERTDPSIKIDSVWQMVMFGLVSEGFGTPEVVGASLHIRGRGYRVCIWNRDNRIEDARFLIADKLRMLLSIHPKQEIKYKFFARALQDGSTTAKAVPYQFVKVTF